MNKARDPSDENDGLSRRDFVQGRFVKAFRFGAKQGSRRGENEKPPTGKKTKLPTPVMRYPQSLQHVSVGDQPQETPKPQEQAMPEETARRRVIPLFRPPGAIDEASFLAGCTKCGECEKACPYDAIVPAPQRLRDAAGTPTIHADHSACLMCQDFPCISACEPGVLTSLVPPTMGTAQVTQHLCLAHHGTTCTVCSERCPIDQAISVADGKPTVKEAVCTGCGVCRYVCPAPENAILLMPAFLRPTPKKT